MTFLRLAAVLAMLALAAATSLTMAFGCTPPNIAGDELKPITAQEAFGGVQCSAVRPQTEPDLMGWDPGSRSNLNRLRRKGIVAVRYQAKGCNVELELLSRCIGTTAAYEFSPYSANEHKLAHNANELFAQLPIGAARLSGTLKGSRVLRTDYMLAGQLALPPGSVFKAADLEGPDCARATHVISAVYIGAFAMAAGDSRVMEGNASLLSTGAGVSAKGSADLESLGDEGDAEACKTSQHDHKENEGCAVPLRVALSELSQPPSQAQPKQQASAKPRSSSSAAPLRLGPDGCFEGMARIPAGKLLMGANDGAMNEKPVHEVEVSAFCMDVTEVTVGAYKACIQSGACSPIDSEPRMVPECNEKTGSSRLPMNCVTWAGAHNYCVWAQKRLPNEEEWEYGARGGSSSGSGDGNGRKYPWGAAQPAGQLCWNRWRPKKGSCEVGTSPADQSPFGLLDMGGNVSEWTASHYANDYTKTASTTNGSPNRVARGGSWAFEDPSFIRTTHRQQKAPTERNIDLGFRCAR